MNDYSAKCKSNLGDQYHLYAHLSMNLEREYLTFNLQNKKQTINLSKKQQNLKSNLAKYLPQFWAKACDLEFAFSLIFVFPNTQVCILHFFPEFNDLFKSLKGPVKLYVIYIIWAISLRISEFETKNLNKL